MKTIDEKAQSVIEKAWVDYTVTDNKVTTTTQMQDNLSGDQHKDVMGNSRVMNAIFSVVDENIFKLIANSEFANEAWYIMQVAHEGTYKVISQHVQMISSRFENLNMMEDETTAQFSARIYDISKESFALAEPIKYENLVSKVLRSLPK